MNLLSTRAAVTAVALSLAAALTSSENLASRPASALPQGESPRQSASQNSSRAQTASAGSSQNSAQPAGTKPLPAPAIRATTRLIEVSVLVHDKHGTPVAGLTKDDFTILDEKQPQTIQIFSVDTNQPASQPAALPPDTYTNRIDQRSSAPKNVTVILLDGLNTEVTDQEYARKQVIKFLGQIQPQDRVGLYTLGLKLTVLHDFTTDSTALLEALNRYKGRLTPELTASTPHELPINPPMPTAAEADLFDAFVNSSSQREANFYTTNRVLMTVEAFETIAHHVAALPGRKNLVWVSGSFPINFGFDDPAQATMTPIDQQLQFEDQVEKAARALNEANLAIYPVDARGLMPYNMNLTKNAVPRAGLQGRPTMVQTPGQAEFATMAILADRTGGRAFYNTNDLYNAIRSAVDDSRVTYELGYYPTNTAWNGKFHEIKVMVNKPGVNVRARKGYFATPDPKNTPADEKAALSAAASSPLESTTIGLTVKVSAADVPGAEEMKTVMHFDAREIPFHQEEGRWKAKIQVVYVQLDRAMKILNAPSETYDLNFSPDRYQRILAAGISNTQVVPILAGASELRVILLDKTSGAIGTVRIPLKPYFPRLASAN